MRIPQGQPVRVYVEIRDLDDVLVEPTTVVLDMVGPLGPPPILGPVAMRDSLGHWHADLDDDELSLLGHYALRWTVTGPGRGVKTDAIDVLDPFAMELLSVADAKAYVQIGADNAEHDTEIERFLMAMAPAIEFFVGGPVEPRTMTRTVWSTGRQLVLPVAPVLEVVSYGMYGVAGELTNISLNTELGVVSLLSGGFYGHVDMVFVAGRRIVPEAMNHAAKVIFAHLWETQRGRGTNTFTQRSGSNSDTTFVPQLGYSVPNRAIQMLRPISTRTGLS